MRVCALQIEQIIPLISFKFLSQVPHHQESRAYHNEHCVDVLGLHSH